jgi:hypothetical protein
MRQHTPAYVSACLLLEAEEPGIKGGRRSVAEPSRLAIPSVFVLVKQVN